VRSVDFEQVAEDDPFRLANGPNPYIYQADLYLRSSFGEQPSVLLARHQGSHFSTDCPNSDHLVGRFD